MKKILGQMTSFSLAVQLTQLITMASGILSRNFLGPTQMGIWATLQLILSYSSYSSLGTSQAIARKVPYYIGKKEGQKAAEIKNLVFSYQTFLAVLTSIGLLAFAFLFKNKLSYALFWGILGAGMLLVLQRINGVQVSVLRAYKEFGIASRLMIWSAVMNLVFIMALAPFFHLYGFIVAMGLSFVFNIVYSARCFDFDFKFKITRQIREVLSFGFPLMVFGVADSFFRSIDKVIVVKMLGFQEMGYYSVAIMFSTFLSQIPNSLGIIMIPHVEEKYGQKESAADLSFYTKKSLEGLSSAMIIITGMAYLAVPSMVYLLMPKYAQGIQAAQYVVLGGYFTAISMPYSTIIVTLKKQIFLLPLIGLNLLMVAFLNVGMIKLGFGIGGVAIGMILSLFFYFLSFHILTNYFFMKAGAGQISLTSSMLRFAYLAVLLTGLEHFFQSSLGAWGVVLRFVFFVIFILPYIFILNRDYHIVGVLTDFIFRLGTKGHSKKTPKVDAVADLSPKINDEPSATI